MCTHIIEGRCREINIATMSKEIELPSKRLFSCDSICAFSKQAKHRLEYEEQCKSARKLCGVLVLSLLFMVVEIVGGIKANSLTILIDAAHLLTDVGGFAISLFAICASGWEPTPHRSYGFFRIEVLGALLSIQLIWLIAGCLIYEAVDRILHKKVTIDGKLMFIIAALGFVVNLVMALCLGHDRVHCDRENASQKHPDTGHVREDAGDASEEEDANLISNYAEKYQYEINHTPEIKIFKTSDDVDSRSRGATADHVIQLENKIGMSHKNMNLQGAYLHVMGDLIQSIGVMIGGAIIWVKPGWQVVDLLCTLVFCLLVIWTTMNMLKSILNILLEGAPDAIDIARLENGLRNIDGVRGVHDLHVWALSAGKVLLACHVTVGEDADSNDVLHSIKGHCEEIYKIKHVTIQIEREESTPTI